jgi:hypothetical protein
VPEYAADGVSGAADCAARCARGTAHSPTGGRAGPLHRTAGGRTGASHGPGNRIRGAADCRADAAARAGDGSAERAGGLLRGAAGIRRRTAARPADRSGVHAARRRTCGARRTARGRTGRGHFTTPRAATDSAPTRATPRRGGRAGSGGPGLSRSHRCKAPTRRRRRSAGGVAGLVDHDGRRRGLIANLRPATERHERACEQEDHCGTGKQRSRGPEACKVCTRGTHLTRISAATDQTFSPVFRRSSYGKLATRSRAGQGQPRDRSHTDLRNG